VAVGLTVKRFERRIPLKALLKRTVLRNISLRARWLALQRALRNATVETAFAKPAVSVRNRYRVHSAAALTRAVPPEEFAAHASGHVTAFAAATLPLPRPQGPIAWANFPSVSASPALTLASLPEALCVPGQIVLARDSGDPTGELFIVSASFTSEAERGSHREILRLDADRFCVGRSVARFQRLPGCYLYLDCYHRSHFGHFLVDVMSMAWAFDEARKLGIESLQILTTAEPAPFMFPPFAAMGISRDAIVPLRRPVQCGRLLIADKCFQANSYTSPTAVQTWRRVRDALDRGTGPERIYFSRSQQPNRHLRNESAVEAIFASRGFQIVHPENLPIEQQVTLWANARLVAGPAGSNMFGLAFQRRLERVLQISSPNMVYYTELMLQAGSAVESTIYLGRSHGNGTHAPWSVDSADLAREVDRWLA
jgi:capsular polysaccharide biosynthesis protein